MYPAAPGELAAATRWISERVEVDPYDDFPLPVSEATALLAAVFADDPLSRRDESRVPNMVRLMILPWMV